jgi:hypothetical protein
MRRLEGVLAVVVLSLVPLVTPTAAQAQWLTYRTPDVPRNADGTPNLNAPPPRTTDGRPDLQGLWTTSRSVIAPPNGVLRPQAQALLQRRQENYFKDRPSFRCLPGGPEVNPEWKRFIQTPQTVAILNENLTYRTIFLDGRTLEADPQRMWMGYSVGRWDGDTLVVESFGFNDRTWLNPVGLPHTDDLRITERYTRPRYGQMQLELTIADAGAFTTPWTASVSMVLRLDTEMIETVCESNSDTWVGSLSDVRATAVEVAPAILAKYVGVYSGLWGTLLRTVRVTLAADGLHATGVLGEDVQLIPQSEVFFAGTDGLTYEFAGADGAAATHLVERHVSGDYRFARQR